MPLRFLQYVVKEYEKLNVDNNLYRRKRISLPAPRFVVFYNGAEYFPEKSELRLSESYEADKDDPQLELKVQVLNINEGNNEKLKEQCRILKDYMQYVDCVRKYTEEIPIEEAVSLAVDECIERGILAEFLRKHKAEVIPMSIFEYNEEETLKVIKADEYDLGNQDGQLKKLVDQVCRKLRKGKTAEVIAEELEEDMENILLICESASEYAPDYDNDIVYEKLRLSREFK